MESGPHADGRGGTEPHSPGLQREVPRVAVRGRLPERGADRVGPPAGRARGQPREPERDDPRGVRGDLLRPEPGPAEAGDRGGGEGHPDRDGCRAEVVPRRDGPREDGDGHLGPGADGDVDPPRPPGPGLSHRPMILSRIRTYGGQVLKLQNRTPIARPTAAPPRTSTG